MSSSSVVLVWYRDGVLPLGGGLNHTKRPFFVPLICSASNFLSYLSDHSNHSLASCASFTSLSGVCRAVTCGTHWSVITTPPLFNLCFYFLKKFLSVVHMLQTVGFTVLGVYSFFFSTTLACSPLLPRCVVWSGNIDKHVLRWWRKKDNTVVTLFILYCLLSFTHCYARTAIIIYTSVPPVSVKSSTIRLCNLKTGNEMKLSLSPRCCGVYSIIT